MIILGVDPALKITGYGIIDVTAQGFSLIDAGTIITQYRQTLPQRLAKIHDSILKLIHKHKPQVMVLEKIYVHYQHPTTAYLLGQARGIICLASATADIPLVEYAATQVKKAVVGRGHASKEQVQRMVASLLHLKALPKYTDITDALALAIAYSYFQKADRLKTYLNPPRRNSRG
jgi:crossover junction endodeoxyribonuclease RuvC